MKDDKVKDFILNTKKKSEITVENVISGHYFIYRFIRTDLMPNQLNVLKVQTKIGTRWRQTGYFKSNGTYINTQSSHIKWIENTSESVQYTQQASIFNKIVQRYITTLKPFNDIKIHHNGHCSICGKKLSTPESIENGIGPVCEKELNKLLKNEY